MQKMSEEIALYCLKADSESYSEVCEECSIYGNIGCDHCYNDAINMAIQALEEIQQYRAIGTVEELKELKYNGAFSGIELANIAASLAELQKYQVIGTVDQCREAVERMKGEEHE